MRRIRSFSPEFEADLRYLVRSEVSQCLASSVPPGSESALRSPFSSDKPPLPSRAGSEIPERGTYQDRAKTHRFDPEVPEGKISATFVLSYQEYHALLATPLPAGGPPTPDLAAQPDSTYEPAYQAINRLERCQIGVHDYASLVSCLLENFVALFPETHRLRGPDPQDMIQLMTATIQNLRRQLEKNDA